MATGRLPSLYRYLPAGLGINARILSPYLSGDLSLTKCSLISTTMTSSTSSVSSSSDLVVDHDSDNKVFIINVGNSEQAILNYEVIGPNAVDLYHTGVPVSQRGKGIAKILAKASLDHFTSEGTNMRLTCTYLQKYFRENPLLQYQDRVMEL